MIDSKDVSELTDELICFHCVRMGRPSNGWEFAVSVDIDVSEPLLSNFPNASNCPASVTIAYDTSNKQPIQYRDFFFMGTNYAFS